MSVQQWTLVDRDNYSRVDDLCVDAQEIGGKAAGYNVRVRTLQGGLSEGLQAIEVDNGTVRFMLLPDRGMGIWKAWHGEEEIGWQSPLAGPVHPRHVPISEPSGLGWLSGFDELFVRCGLESNGAPEFDANGKLLYPVHGRIANLPAQRVQLEIDGDSGEIRVTGEVEESRFHFQKLRLKSTITTRPGQRGFEVTDTVTNIGGGPTEAQMLYHINFGAPVCLPGSVLHLPINEMCPRDHVAADSIDHWETFGEQDASSSEQVYFYKLLADAEGWATAAVHNAEATRGASVRYHTESLPCFTVWKNTPPLADGYCTGLEPGTNFPNPRSHERAQGRVVPLGAGESVEFRLGLKYHASAEQVAEAVDAAASRQQAKPPTIHREPQSGWCR